MKYIVMSVATAALIGMTGCSSDSDDSSSGGGSAQDPDNYPSSIDNFEGANGDNDISSAGAIVVGDEVQSRTLFPSGDYDFVAVELEKGSLYEFFTTNLNYFADTYLYLLDENGIELTSADDYMYLDSNIQEYNATYSGTHYLRVQGYSEDYEVASYQLGARKWVDADDDGHSTFFDCNDNNDTINPYEDDIPGDGIDNDCSGVDALAADTVDRFEIDDDNTSAKPALEIYGHFYEKKHHESDYSQQHTIHTAGQEDYVSLVIPSNSAVEFDYENGVSLTMVNFDENGSLINSNSTIENTSNRAQTYYRKYSADDGTSTGWYVAGFATKGQDSDGDGYYPMDWAGDFDCNENNASINPGASEVSDIDGIDQNCDGSDG